VFWTWVLMTSKIAASGRSDWQFVTVTPPTRSAFCCALVMYFTSSAKSLFLTDFMGTCLAIMPALPAF
jgi:hypothetical protein